VAHFKNVLQLKTPRYMEKKFTNDDIMQMERFYRTAFINTVSGFKNASLIGTQSPEGVSNLAIFNSVVHIGANPPYLGFILRPTTVERHTYTNLKTTGHYTINHVRQDLVAQAHQTSAKYPAGTSEFEACGFTPKFSESLQAPYVQESSIKIGLEYVEEQPIRANGTILIIGKVLEILLPEAFIRASGHVELAQAQSTAVAGLDSYYRAELLTRLAYARPKEQPKKLE
jgi:flavin reductase (DIM6/NTAB) family NADH-FMN oxidoreductase RutF